MFDWWNSDYMLVLFYLKKEEIKIGKELKYRVYLKTLD